MLFYNCSSSVCQPNICSILQLKLFRRKGLQKKKKNSNEISQMGCLHQFYRSEISCNTLITNQHLSLLPSTLFDSHTGSYVQFKSQRVLPEFGGIYAQPYAASIYTVTIPAVFDKNCSVLIGSIFPAHTFCLRRKSILQELLKFSISTRRIQAALQSMPGFL